MSLPTRASVNARRHALIAEYRRKVMAKYEIVWFPHQAEWILASEGWVLTDQAPSGPSDPQTLVMLDDESIEPRLLLPRPGGAAHALVDLAGFKGGKSFSLALFMAGFAGVDGAVDLIGLEYDTSEPEFNYLVEFLLSERGMNLPTAAFRNHKKDGAMWIELENGARFECKSYRASRKSETMKGKTRDCYAFTEAYQLPGLHVYSHVSQNLRQRDGFAAFATTPDRAWVRELHDKGHGNDDTGFWHCTCDIDAKCNPFTFDQSARDRDDPDKGGLMTRERFAVAWGGKVHRHIGAVYDYEKDAQMCSPLNFPQLWDKAAISQVLEVIQ